MAHGVPTHATPASPPQAYNQSCVAASLGTGLELPLQTSTPTVLSSPLSFISEPNLYENALERARRGEVSCRKIHLHLAPCATEAEFLASVECIRSGYAVLLAAEAHRSWMLASGSTILAKLLKRMQRPSERLQGAMDSLVLYVSTEMARDNGMGIREELRVRRVADISFYDLVLDFTFLDALEDLEVRETR